MKMYDVNTHAKKDYTTIEKGKRVAQKLFDTPSLVELWRTAPYMHDGRYMTINDVVTRGEMNSAHNVSSQLSMKEIEDLVSYLLSI
jgi:cytochrome c peroxidase